ncbi:MAG: hypothetical protein K0B02_02345 [DPANN group archaeon]|nr:hypothetical protein [DPANN group archaeon]
MGNDRLWAENILQKIGYANIAYTGNSWTSRCLEPYIKIKQQEMIERNLFRGTNIRKLIRIGDLRWKNYIHPKVTRYIEDKFPIQI